MSGRNVRHSKNITSNIVLCRARRANKTPERGHAALTEVICVMSEVVTQVMTLFEPRKPQMWGLGAPKAPYVGVTSNTVITIITFFKERRIYTEYIGI